MRVYRGKPTCAAILGSKRLAVNEKEESMLRIFTGKDFTRPVIPERNA